MVEYIRSNVEILLNIKSDYEGSVESEREKSLGYPDFFSQASSILSKDSKPKLNNEGYEKMIQKLESDIRNHIRAEQQLKLYCENLAEKLEHKKSKSAETKKHFKRVEELLKLKEKEIIELKTTILQHEEEVLK